MTYNLHPIFVHFPIALFTIYSFIKIFPFRRWMPRVSWLDIERVLLVFGIFGAFFALGTGDTAEHLYRGSRAIVEVHSGFASASVWIYGILLFGEFLAILNKEFFTFLERYPKILKVSKSLEKIIKNRIIGKFLALIAFVVLFVAGVLGGVMVYGTTADPFASMILNLLGLGLST